VYLDEYQIGRYEVTNQQYNQCIQSGTCKGFVVTDKLDHPVVNVDWYQAKTYCGWVGGRLPTEAEWEKAASWDVETQTKYIYPWGNNAPTPELSNFNGNVGDTTPVGTYPAGENGLYDMAGNVWEWVNDWYQSDYYATLGDKASNPQGPEKGNVRVLRGGSWNYFENYFDNYSRSAIRDYLTPDFISNYVGFRCARTP